MVLHVYPVVMHEYERQIQFMLSDIHGHHSAQQMVYCVIITAFSVDSWDTLKKKRSKRPMDTPCIEENKI